MSTSNRPTTGAELYALLPPLVHSTAVPWDELPPDTRWDMHAVAGWLDNPAALAAMAWERAETRDVLQQIHTLCDGVKSQTRNTAGLLAKVRDAVRTWRERTSGSVIPGLQDASDDILLAMLKAERERAQIAEEQLAAQRRLTAGLVEQLAGARKDVVKARLELHGQGHPASTLLPAAVGPGAPSASCVALPGCPCDEPAREAAGGDVQHQEGQP